MYNIKVLEEEWKKYNRKKRRPWYILFTIILLGGISSVVILYQDNMPEFSFSLKNKKSSPAVENSREKVFIDKALTQLESKNTEKLVDAPMDTGEILDESGVSEIEDTPIKKKKLHIEVIEVGKHPSSYKEIEKRFRLGHDTDDSLFLAKSYYKKGNYKKAEYWALQTNKINVNIEESWLIFAKAKVKRGKRNEAIRILNSYIKRTRSAEAKALLEKIKNGKI